MLAAVLMPTPKADAATPTVSDFPELMGNLVLGSVRESLVSQASGYLRKIG
jgi:hypothetical protein